MKAQEFKSIDAFFKSVKEMPSVLKGKSTELRLISDSKRFRSWVDHISPAGLVKIFEWLAKEDNESLIRDNIALSPNQATLLTYQKTGLYLTIEIILRNEITHLFLSTKSKIANCSDDIQLKAPKLTEEEIKLGYRKMKQIEEGSFKKVQYCFHWQPGILEPHVYAVSILTGKNALASATQEEKMSRIIGENYANPCIAGDFRFKKGKRIINLYSPLALGSQFNWVNGEGMTPIFKMPPLHFFFSLFKQVSSLAWLHHLGIIWRDLKEENHLVFSSLEGEIQLKMIDFSSAEFISSDDVLLKNYIGTPAYFPPEHDFFLDLRKAKINELVEYNKYLSLKKSISLLIPNAENKHQISELNDAYIEVKRAHQHRRTQVLRCQDSINKILPEACMPAIALILNCSDIKKLLSEKNKFAFLSHPKDDVWNLSILMVNVVSKYLRKHSLSPHHKFLKIVQQYFQDNLKLFRASRPSAEQIVTEFLQLFKIAYPSKDEEIHTWVAKLQKQEQDFKKNLNGKKEVLSPIPSKESLKQSFLTTQSSSGVFGTPKKASLKVTLLNEKENIPQNFKSATSGPLQPSPSF